jgi:nitrile hydratase beta subunit
MNSLHDLGGMDGFGHVQPEPGEPVFHAPWEGRVYALQRALGAAGLWTIDQSRASIEAMDPLDYLQFSYYKKWFTGLEQRLLERRVVDADELAAGKALRAVEPPARTFSVADVATLKRADFARPAAAQPRFAIGDHVSTRNLNPATHTRLPRYAREKNGLIEALRGCHVFPDTVATGAGEQPQWLYTVVFTARELWGDDADPALTISIEAFEPYLVPA